MDHIIELLDSWITATAWRIETPKAYGLFHLSFTIIGVLVCIFAARKLRNLSDKGNRILLVSVGVFLILAEVYKQLLYYFVIDRGNGYSWGVFPFHLCSVPMYLCVIAPLLKPGPVQKGMYSFMMLYNLLGGGISFTEPSGLLHPYATLTAHAMIWHMLLVFVGLYLVFSGRGGWEMRDYWASTKTFLALCAAAFCINLLFWDVSEGGINMFFVGPRNSSIIVFKQISEAFGWYVSTALYIPSICLGAYLIYLLVRLYHNKKAPAAAKR